MQPAEVHTVQMVGQIQIPRRSLTVRFATNADERGATEECSGAKCLDDDLGEAELGMYQGWPCVANHWDRSWLNNQARV